MAQSITKICLHCKAEFEVPRHKFKARKFCSPKCYHQQDAARRLSEALWWRAQGCPRCHGPLLKHRICGNCRNLEYRRRSKAEVIKRYGGQCACCGETEFEFLTLDHIAGDGAERRRSDVLQRGYPLAGHSLYLQLRQQGYPTGFQILCWNCNCSKGMYGFCPHQRKT